MKHAMEPDTAFIKNNFKNSRPVSNSRDKAVQTDIQDVNSRLVCYAIYMYFIILHTYFTFKFNSTAANTSKLSFHFVSRFSTI